MIFIQIIPSRCFFQQGMLEIPHDFSIGKLRRSQMKLIQPFTDCYDWLSSPLNLGAAKPGCNVDQNLAISPYDFSSSK